MIRIIPLLLAISISTIVIAQTETRDLVTDRPDQTESSITVPHKSLQIETGFVKETQGNTTGLAYNTTLLRYGLLENLELRFGLEYLGEKNDQTNIDYSGLSPLYAGFKINVRKEDGWKPEVAFLGAIAMPFTADDAFKPKDVAANMHFALSHTLSDRFSLGYNIGIEWDGDNATPSYPYSLALGISLIDKLGMYIEGFGAFMENNNTELLTDGGFTYLILPNFQADISGGIGLTDNAIDNYLSIGLTYRLPQ